MASATTKGEEEASVESGGASQTDEQRSIATSNATISFDGLPPKPIDYKRLLMAFFKKVDPSSKKSAREVDELLAKYQGKEPKYLLLLAKKYDASNALNYVFKKRVTDAHFDDYVALVKLYLSVFYPQDIGQAEALCSTYEGKEDELFKKLAKNFHAINPMKMSRGSKAEEAIDSQPIDYTEVLTAFYKEHDEEKVADVEATLRKCPQGKEAILFAVIASKYNAANALNSVFEERLKGTDCKDYQTLLRLYFSIFHPSKVSEAKSMLGRYQGREPALFAKLAEKFRACHPLEACDRLGKTILGSIDEETEEATPAMIEEGGGCASPTRGARKTALAVPQSPAVTP